MPTTISGTTGVSLLQDGTVTSVKIVNGSVTPADTQVGALPSCIRLNTANGHGSTNNKIRRFTNTVLNQGGDVTYADSATLGATFTVNTNGVYVISYNDQFAVSANFGISLNSTALTSTILAIPIGEALAGGTTTAGNLGMNLSWAGYLPAGSVVRAHTDGAAGGTSTNYSLFTMARVA